MIFWKKIFQTEKPTQMGLVWPINILLAIFLANRPLGGSPFWPPGGLWLLAGFLGPQMATLRLYQKSGDNFEIPKPIPWSQLGNSLHFFLLTCFSIPNPSFSNLKMALFLDQKWPFLAPFWAKVARQKINSSSSFDPNLDWRRAFESSRSLLVIFFKT